jgi:hypothetical protein
MGAAGWLDASLDWIGLELIGAQLEALGRFLRLDHGAGAGAGAGATTDLPDRMHARLGLVILKLSIYIAAASHLPVC